MLILFVYKTIVREFTGQKQILNSKTLLAKVLGLSEKQQAWPLALVSVAVFYGLKNVLQFTNTR